MTKTTTLFSTLSLLLFLAVVVPNLGFCYATTGKWANQTTHKTSCIPAEREALLEFKKHLVDSTNRLATWDAAAAADDDDCCSWYGVSCHPHLVDSTIQYVTGLRLRSLSSIEFYDIDRFGEWSIYWDTVFGGKVSSALLILKHLRYLDLSNNDFNGISIPSFLGSMRSLRYLNLSSAGFEGMIPHQLGNLSNLQYLNLKTGNYYGHANVGNLQWMSGLSSLKFLDLSGWNFSKVLNWNNVILTTLPSLLQLHLSDCQLPTPQPHLPNNNNINASSISILDFSRNNIAEHSTIFLSWVSGLKTLSSLNIEVNRLYGSIPTELQNMSSLRELYLGFNDFNSSLSSWVYGSHTTLKVLSLHHNKLSSFQPQSSSQSVNNFSSLSILDLSYNNFEGPIPDEIQNMTSLQTLDLSHNKFSSFVPDALTPLRHLDLSNNNLEGNISNANWNMPSLISLDMTFQLGNKLEIEGGIPQSFKNCCSLRKLKLQGVKLRQDINQVFEILSLPGCVSNGVEELYLTGCELFGNLATTNQYFDRLISLKSLFLGFNSLRGTLPLGLGRLEKLEKLYLNDNSLAGDILEDHFENLKDLQIFVAVRNPLKLRVSPNWIPHFDQLYDLNLGSWHIGPQFPTWLRSLKNLKYLYMSSSGISSTIPIWFWNFSSTLNCIDLSHNEIYGVLPVEVTLNFSAIDMSSNFFHGPLPLVSPHVIALDLSNNSFSGSISEFLCPPDFNSSGVPQDLEYLNLDQNSLHGEIPNCLIAWPQVQGINLSNNKLNGTIPESIGTLHWLGSLHLGNNSLSGELPQSLSRCANLITMEVGGNELVGNISNLVTVESFSGMKILILRSNKFSGQLPEQLCHATSLQILDLANNLFDGTIPFCLGNLSAMTKMNESTGVIRTSTGTIETAFLGLKGNMLEYRTNLGFVRSLDFSNNKLGGRIPDEITSLYGLVSLNLSHNAFSGGIPKNIGSMQKLNSLDLSTNQLSGEIPPSISNLTSLGKLNLSHNRLSGRIPFGNQIQTFDASSFVSNELCGNPLPNKCSNDTGRNDAHDKGGDDGDGMIWFYASMAFGFVGGFWCFVGPLLLKRRWRFAYSQFLDRMWEKIWWKLHRFGMF